MRSGGQYVKKATPMIHLSGTGPQNRLSSDTPRLSPIMKYSPGGIVIVFGKVQELPPPQGSMYAFVGVNPMVLPDFDDQEFALDLLEQKHVLVAPGVSFNVPYRNHFRITNLPDAATLREVFVRIEELLATYGTLARKRDARESVARNVVRSVSRLK